MPVRFTAEPGGIRIGAGTASGVAIGGAVVYRAGRADRGGALTVTGVATTRSREIYTFTLADPDGIRSVGTLNLTARDGNAATVELQRVDANTFRGTRTSANDRWLTGTAVVNYTDAASGTIHTITQPYSVST